MGAKNNENSNRKREPPLAAPIRVLNEFRDLTELARDSKKFQEFKPPSKGDLKSSALFCPSKEPYNEKAWRIEFEIPRDYPQNPPKVKFLTKIYHPNVSQSGEVKLEILEKKEWKDSVTLTDVTNALLDLIENPNAENSKLILNDEAAKQFKDKNNDFIKKAQEFANKNALARPPEQKRRGSKNDAKNK